MVQVACHTEMSLGAETSEGKVAAPTKLAFRTKGGDDVRRIQSRTTFGLGTEIYVERTYIRAETGNIS